MSKCEVHIPEKKERNKIFITNDFLTTENHQNVNICGKILKCLLFMFVFLIIIGCFSFLTHLEKSDYKILLLVRKEIQVKKLNEINLNKNDSEKDPEIRNPVINMPIEPQNGMSRNNEKIYVKNVEKGSPLGSDSLLIKTQNIGDIQETTERISQDIPSIFNIFEKIWGKKDDNKTTESPNIEPTIHLPLMRKIIIFRPKPRQENEISTEKFNLNNNDKPLWFIPLNRFNFLNSFHFPNIPILPQFDNFKSDSESENSDGKCKMVDSEIDSVSDESDKNLDQMMNNRRYIYPGLSILNPSKTNFDQVNSESEPNEPKYFQRIANTHYSFDSVNSFRKPPSSEERDNLDKPQKYLTESDSKSSQDISESEDNLSERHIYRGHNPVLQNNFDHSESEQNEPKQYQTDMLRRIISGNSFRIPFNIRFKLSEENLDNSEKKFSESDSKSSQDISESKDLSSNESIDNIKGKLKNLSIPTKSVEFI